MLEDEEHAWLAVLLGTLQRCLCKLSSTVTCLGNQRLVWMHRFESVLSSESAEGWIDAPHRYKAVIEDEEHERLHMLLGTLERKDEAQQRMESVTHLQVTAWRCATCNCTTDKRRTTCQVIWPSSHVLFMHSCPYPELALCKHRERICHGNRVQLRGSWGWGQIWADFYCSRACFYRQ